jgi:hypothetical protein
MVPASPLDYLALLVWLPISAVLFALKKPHLAALAVLVLGYSYLPEQTKIELPVFPDLSKEMIAPLSAFVLAFVFGKGLLRKVKFDGKTKFFMAAIFMTDVVRVFLNRDAFRIGRVLIPAVEVQSSVTNVLEDWLYYMVPFTVGLAIARNREWVLDALRSWLVMAGVYGLLVMFEARLSPQLHTKLYGFFQHDWIQMVRNGGFRPIVFMNHALEVALYMSMSTLVAVVALRRGKVIKGPVVVVLYFVFCTLLCKSSGSIGMMMLGMGLIFFTKASLQVRFARVLALLIFLVPVIRASGYFPTDQIITWATNLTNADRAASLAYRFRNDDALVLRTMNRPYFGWGGYARGFVYDDNGKSSTVVDGFWIISFNERGFIGYYALFGLMTLPIFVAAKRINKIDKKDRSLLGGLTLIHAFYCFDLLVNGLFNAFPFLFGGLVLGISKNAWPQLSSRNSMLSIPPERRSVPAPHPSLPSLPAR